MTTAEDEECMRQAVREAKKGLGLTSPNPAVGAVLAVDGKIVARGHHRGAGLPHAEVECLRRAGSFNRKQAILYVTLEPCSTTGRTPPCTEGIINAGIKNVVVGTEDVNPNHRGRGLVALREAGINVQTSALAAECQELNVAFNKWIQTKRPFVIAKCGMSLDGRLSRRPGESTWLTSAAARQHANRARSQVDAILVGAETVRADNPRLTVRGVRGAGQPWRIVLTRSGEVGREAHLFTDEFADRTLVFRNRPLPAVLEELGAREITSVLIEGGGEVLGQALDARVIDRVQIYVAPLLTGGPVIAFPGHGADTTLAGIRVRRVRYEEIGGDILITGDAAEEGVISE